MKSVQAVILSAIFLVISLFFASPVFAQNLPAQNTSLTTSSNTNSNVPNTTHNWVQTVLVEVSSAMTCQLVGIDPSDPNAKCLGVDPKTHKIGYVENGGGAIAVLGSMMAATFDIPVHTGDFTGYMASNFGFSKHAYAATSGCEVGTKNNPKLGIGYCGLSPLLPMWEVFRNIVYLIFVLIFMIIGIAIMLRVKIDPRTVMSIENQIPKLVVGLILVTFSYAIAGFLIDMMYVSIYLVFSVLHSIPNADISVMSPENLQGITAIGMGDKLSGANQGATLFSTADFIGTIASNLSDVIRSLLHLDAANLGNITPLGGVTDIFNLFQNKLSGSGSPVSFFNLLADLVSFSASATTAGQIAANAEGSVEFLIFKFGADAKLPTFIALFGTFYVAFEFIIRDLLPYAIPFLIILMATLWALFRLWLTLIQAYIFILLDVATAPFWLLLGLIPGSKLGFSAWFRDILANIAVFPVTLTMFWIGKIFVETFGGTPVNGQFLPPLIGNPGSTNFLGAIIAIGIILTTPEVLKQTRAFLKAPELDLKGVGAAIGKGTAAPGRLIGGTTSTLLSGHYADDGNGGTKFVLPGGPLGKLVRGFGLGGAH